MIKRMILLAVIALLMICVGALAEEEKAEMQILVTDGMHEVLFTLNDTPAAQSLYAQLPLEIEVDNYGSNEKIFYPPEKLDGILRRSSVNSTRSRLRRKR